MNNYEQMAVAVFKDFLNSYSECREEKKALSFLGDTIFSIGTGKNESVVKKSELALLIHDEILAAPRTMLVNYHYIEAAQVSETVVIIQSEAMAKIAELDNEDVTLEVRLSATLVFDGEQFKIVSLHCSTATAIQDEEEFVPLRFAEKTIKELKSQNKHTILSLLDTAVSVGVVGFYLEEDLPVYFLNNEFVSALGYSSDEEFLQDRNAMVMNCIHPDDRLRVKYDMALSLEQGDDYIIEFRLRRKNGSYMWVNSRGKRTIAEDGRQAAVSICLDITQRICMQQELQQKNSELMLKNRELETASEKLRVVLSRANNIDLNIVFEADITENRPIGDYSHIFNKLGYPEPASYDEAIELLADYYILEDFKEEYMRKLSRENILDLFANGQNFVEYECMRRAETGTIWIRLNVCIFRSKVTGSVRIITYVKDIDARKKREQSLIERGMKDSLTGLYNTVATRELVEEKMISNDRGVLMILDIDNFKLANDNNGHMFGDQVLCQIADSFRTIFRDSDILGRVGGDEFLIYMPDLADGKTIRQKAKDLCKCAFAAYESENGQWNVSLSIGIAIYPDSGISYEELYANADNALYFSKEHGKNTYSIYNPSMGKI